MKCPHCNKTTGILQKCNACNHVVCWTGTCKGKTGGGWANGGKCRMCKKGKLVKI